MAKFNVKFWPGLDCAHNTCLLEQLGVTGPCWWLLHFREALSVLDSWILFFDWYLAIAYWACAQGSRWPGVVISFS